MMKLRDLLLTAVIIAGIADFAFFGIAVSRYGGAVPSGPMFRSIPANGPYLLDNHGRYTEVDRRTYTRLELQSRSLFVVWPLAGVCLWLRKRKGSW